MAKTITSDVYPIKIKNNIGDEMELEIAECPTCCGMFGVDTSYLDQRTDIVSCPMCGERVHFNWYEKETSKYELLSSIYDTLFKNKQFSQFSEEKVVEALCDDIIYIEFKDKCFSLSIEEVEKKGAKEASDTGKEGYGQR